MHASRRLFVVCAVSAALVTPAAAVRGATLDGVWQGQLTPVAGPIIDRPQYTFRTLRITIDGDRVQVFTPDEEVKPGAFRITRLTTNAVITAIDASPRHPIGRSWVETWSLAVTLNGPDTIDVVFTRHVNNNTMDRTAEDAIFTIVASGPMHRVPDANV